VHHSPDNHVAHHEAASPTKRAMELAAGHHDDRPRLARRLAETVFHAMITTHCRTLHLDDAGSQPSSDTHDLWPDGPVETIAAQLFSPPLSRLPRAPK
jgi:hypothetical protein